eukprot:m.140806 g.140806  ORF g.140806 m.140806 type:complete len:395 (+) comp38329_c0_seq1:1038-2222(+)
MTKNGETSLTGLLLCAWRNMDIVGTSLRNCSAAVIQNFAVRILEKYTPLDEGVGILDGYIADRKVFSSSDVSNVLCLAVETDHAPVISWMVEHGADVSSFCEKALIAAAKAGKYAMVELLVSLGANIQEASETAKRQHYTSIAPVLFKSASYPMELFAQDEHARQIYLPSFEEGSVEATFIRVDVVGKDGAGKTSLRKSLTNQKFVANELSTVGVEFDRKCEIVVTKSCNWRKSLTEEDHLDAFEKILSSDVAARTRSDAIAAVEKDTKMEKREKGRERRKRLNSRKKSLPFQEEEQTSKSKMEARSLPVSLPVSSPANAEGKEVSKSVCYSGNERATLSEDWTELEKLNHFYRNPPLRGAIHLLPRLTFLFNPLKPGLSCPGLVFRLLLQNPD